MTYLRFGPTPLRLLFLLLFVIGLARSVADPGIDVPSPFVCASCNGLEESAGESTIPRFPSISRLASSHLSSNDEVTVIGVLGPSRRSEKRGSEFRMPRGAGISAGRWATRSLIVSNGNSTVPTHRVMPRLKPHRRKTRLPVFAFTQLPLPPSGGSTNSMLLSNPSAT